MMIGIGTPRSHNKIPLPMSALLLLAVLIGTQ
jgi:hypothetical protein